MVLYRAVFGEEGARQKGYPDYIYPVNILHDAGIYADVRIYPAIWESVYESVDEAARNWVTLHNPGQVDLAPVEAFFSRVLKKDPSGRYRQTAVRRTAVISWGKEHR